MYQGNINVEFPFTLQPHKREAMSSLPTVNSICASCAGGNPESNTLISDMTTVICLDDYHALDRNGRKREGVTALDPKAQDFELMYDQIKALKERQSVDKPIYNHVSGLLDPPESIKPPPVCFCRLRPAETLALSGYPHQPQLHERHVSVQIGTS